MRKRLAPALAAAFGLLALAAGQHATRAQGAGNWTTLKGQLVYGGPNVPARQPLNVNKDQNHCLAKGPVLSEEWVVDATTKGVKNGFVWLDSDPPGKDLPVHPDLKAIKQKIVTVDQPQCAFVPHAFALREGQILTVKNSAPVAHNVGWMGGRIKNPGGNVIVPPGGQHVINNLKADRLPIQIKCDIHPWMRGWVRVFNHPYFAVTDEQGNFEMKSAPVGKFRMFIWHEAVGWRKGVEGKNGEAIEIKAGPAHDVGKLDIQ
jgi:hypothetical protein